jgi:hypothetical protein
MRRRALKYGKKDVFGGREVIMFESYLGSQTPISAFLMVFWSCFVEVSWFETLKFSKGVSNSVCNWPCCQDAFFSTSLRNSCFSCGGWMVTSKESTLRIQ